MRSSPNILRSVRLNGKPVASVKRCCYSSVSAFPPRNLDTFKYADLDITVSSNRTFPPADTSKLKFGASFSEHMLEVDWSLQTGWGRPRIVPMHNFSMHPASKCLHYAIELFEGMKAYYSVDNRIKLFRPEMNINRMLASAHRAALPLFDGEELLQCVKELIKIDRHWVPPNSTGTSSLYIRPSMIGTDPTLGVAKSNEAKLFVIMGPVGAYFPTGVKPVTLLADPQFVRAWVGGCGSHKLGANYASTIQIQNFAQQKGAQQVLWLYGEDRKITEVGTMNIFVYWINENGEKELVTPPLSDGLILPGVTRHSLLELGRTYGDFKVKERHVTMADLITALNENRLLEVFGSGTACVVCPVETILYENTAISIPTMQQPAPLFMRFLSELNDIQYGRTVHEWCVDIDDGLAIYRKKSRGQL